MHASDSPEVTSDEIIEPEEIEETTEETPELEAVAPPTLEEALDAVDDGSRIAEGFDPEELLADLRTSSESVRLADTRMMNAYKRHAASLARVRRHVLTPSGMPDWAGNTRTYNVLAERAYDEAFVAMSREDRRRISTNVRAHLNRGGALEKEIRAYVGDMEAIREVKDAEGNVVVDENGNPVVETVRLYPNGPDDTNQTFLGHVRLQYIGQGNAAEPDLAVPRAYQSVEDRARESGSTGGPGAGPKSALAAAFAGVEGLSGVSENYAAMVALRNVSDVVKRVTTGKGEVKDRPKVEDTLDRISKLSMYGAKYLAGQAKETDLASIADLFWNDEDETYQSQS